MGHAELAPIDAAVRNRPPLSRLFQRASKAKVLPPENRRRRHHSRVTREEMLRRQRRQARPDESENNPNRASWLITVLRLAFPTWHHVNAHWRT